jgi:hypothetical protein
MAEGHLGGECKDWLECVSATERLSGTMPDDKIYVRIDQYE